MLHLSGVQRLQNRAARIMSRNYSREVSGLELVRDMGWFNVKERRQYFTALTVFKSIHGPAPSYMQDLFTCIDDFSERPTRSADNGNLYIPRVNRQVFTQSIQYNGAKIWNELPREVRTLPALHTFKRSLKNIILH